MQDPHEETEEEAHSSLLAKWTNTITAEGCRGQGMRYTVLLQETVAAAGERLVWRTPMQETVPVHCMLEHFRGGPGE